MKRFVNLLFALLTVLISVYALGVTPAKIDLDFIPGEVHNLSLKIDNQQGGNATYSISFEGELGGYLSTSDKTNAVTIEGKSSKTIYLILSLPESLEKAGQRTASATISETTPAHGAIAVLTAMKVPISVFVPYPGKYAEIFLSIQDIEEREAPVFKAAAKNMGKKRIGSMIITIEVYNNDLLVESLSFASESLEPQSKTEVVIRSKKAYSAGEYNVVAYGSYDGLTTPKERGSLRVGALLVNITDYTSEIEKGRVNRFIISLRSLWNKPVHNVAAELKLLDLNNSVKDEVKTSSVDIGPWQIDQITTFLDATNLSVGDYKVETKLLYEGLERSEILPVTVKENVVEEQPAKDGLDKYKYIIIGSIILGLLIAIMDIIFVVYFKKRQRKYLNKFKSELDRGLL